MRHLILFENYQSTELELNPKIRVEKNQNLLDPGYS